MLVRTGVGSSLSGIYKKKLSFNLKYITENSSYFSYTDSLIDSLHIVPSFGYNIPTKIGRGSNWFSGYISYSPDKIFNLQFGQGKHFFGDGYRSLLLSDNAYNYPYLKITTKVWKIKYVNLFTAMRDIRVGEGSRTKYTKKFLSTHYLSYNIVNWLSVGLFETVIWQGEDTLLQRGFEVSYLNPIIFYRPVEFSQGSSDNVLVGMNLKSKLSDNHQIYFQALLDEFLLEQIRANDGWWGNKYGFQFGYKWFNVGGIDNLHFQSEFNIVRPFTYSHGAVTQNYGHMNQPLAHPIGANFKESVNFVRYSKGKIRITEQFNYTIYGLDSANVNKGGNIYQSYQNRMQELGHFITQGIKTNVVYNKFSLAYILSQNLNLRLELGYIFRESKNALEHQQTNYIFFSIKTGFRNQYLDY